MKKFIVLLFSVRAFVGFAETVVPTIVNTLKFSTHGCDCYEEVGEDGYNVPVMEGECYALVWQSKEVKEFPGLPRNPLNPDLPSVNGIWVAQYFSVAEDDGAGYMHCPEVAISGLSRDDNTNGTWTVYLLDTRYLDEYGEVVCGFDSSVTNTPRCINAYMAIDNLKDFQIGTSPVSPSTGESYETTTLTGGYSDIDPDYIDMIADFPAVLPADCPTPQFAAITNGNGEVTLSVTNTATYLAYDISMTNDLAKVHSTTNFVGGIKQGVGAGPLTWTIPVGAEKQGFFKVLPRKPDFSK